MHDRAVAVVVREGSVLMVEHVDAARRYWTLPGGGLEPGETPGQAALRELDEETGLRGSIVRELYRLPLETCFLCHVDAAQEPALGTDPELSGRPAMLTAVAWVPIARLTDDIQVRLVLPELRAAGLVE